MKAGMVIGAIVFVAVVVRSAHWAAARILGVFAVALVLGAVALALYHRRKLAELHNVEAEVIGGWRRISRAMPWPKACRECGATAHDWRSIRAHGDPQRSACAAHLASMEAAGAAPEPAPEPVSAWVVATGRGQGAGAVDTLTEGRKPALEDGL